MLPASGRWYPLDGDTRREEDGFEGEQGIERAVGEFEPALCDGGHGHEGARFDAIGDDAVLAAVEALDAADGDAG
jgi:Icc-related predicted phosphoesterase